MSWFKRLKDGIQTATKFKKEAPDGLWHKCKDCQSANTYKELKENFFICPKCDYHVRIGSYDYFDIIYDGKYQEIFPEYVAKDLMGSVVGEKISKAIDYALEHSFPLMIISKSGGARMMESAFSLMQMAKTSAKLAMLSKAGIPYFSFLTDPTTGGVTASYAMLGDINFAEPKALIGFAGPRVIKETIKKDLPEGFQRSEFLLDHGFLDFIVDRRNLREKIDEMLSIFKPKQ